MVDKSNLYTKGGDKGETSLVGGTRLSKSDARIYLYGEVDELNSFLGYAKCYLSPEKYAQDLDLINKIQNALFDLGSNLACEIEKRETFSLPQIKEELIAAIEQRIDACDGECPPLKNFILPGSSKESASFHIVRTVCRRIERQMIAQQDLAPERSLVLLNRLSDYFFILSRYIDFKEGNAEQLWRPEK